MGEETRRCSINAIGRRVERLTRTLEPQSFPSEVSRCRTVSQDKWEALYQVREWRQIQFRRWDDRKEFPSIPCVGLVVTPELRGPVHLQVTRGKNRHMARERWTKKPSHASGANSESKPSEAMLEILPAELRMDSSPSASILFCAKVSQMLARKHRLSYCNRSDLHWLAVLFAACGLGLWASETPVEQDHDIELPRTKLGQRRLALIWLRCASSALVLGRE
ncbi:hypothetical protein Pst134EA_032152 [Puccinia striiformis f. sp. tritici]|uniref:uncharacterized protein n=1 Tax=Puccinia striiformis f. sp. tritici TaxID=168172 RepID=UPI002007C75B|nr:uncharacterized protein Pst134EA_032152 [Puccinia striiformis f. sp. tritici]KAH9440645.1 hypothetical protein Pst134EA_032152 [Puccinia striiformis f. sp. tritici]